MASDRWNFYSWLAVGRGRTDFRLRNATPEDRDLLYTIQSDALREYVVATWGGWDEPWQKERFNSTLTRRGFESWFLTNSR